MNRRLTIAKNERFRKKYEQLFINRIDKALKSQVKVFIAAVKEGGIQAGISENSVYLMNNEIATVMMRLYQVAGKAKAAQVYQQLIKESRKAKAFGFNATWTQAILDYFSQYLYSKVVLPITQTTKAMLSLKIDEMITNGYSIEWLVQQVENPAFLGWRARMIARTESNRAINFGAQIGAQKTGFETWKEWVAVHDNRTRHEHRLLDTKKVSMNDEFAPGLQFPGDPNATAAQTINCRCHLNYSLKRDANGKPIGAPGQSYTVSRRQAQTARRLINLLS